MEPIVRVRAVLKQHNGDSAVHVEPLHKRMAKKRAPFSQTANAMYNPAVILQQPPLHLALSASFSHAQHRNTMQPLMQKENISIGKMLVKQELKNLEKLASSPSASLAARADLAVTQEHSHVAFISDRPPVTGAGEQHLTQHRQKVNDYKAGGIDREKVKDEQIRTTLSESAGLVYGPLGTRDAQKMITAMPLERNAAAKQSMKIPFEQSTATQATTKMTYNFRSWGQGRVDISDLNGQLMFQPSDNIVRERLSLSLHRDGPAAWQMSEDNDRREHPSHRQQQEDEEEL